MRRFAVVLAFAACHDAGQPVVQPAAAPSVATAGPDLRDPFALMPSDSDVFFSIDVAALRRSPLWAKYKSSVVELAGPSFAACGYDPFDDITLITAGMPLEGQLGVFVIRGLDRDKLLHCLHTPTPETATTVTYDGDFITFTNKSGTVNLMTFVDAHNAVMQGSTHPTKETLTQALKVGAPLRKDADLVAAVDKLAPNAAVSLVSRPGSQGFAKMMEQKTGAPSRSLAATFHLTDHVEVHAAIMLRNADDAAAIVAQMQPRIAGLKPYVDRFDERAQSDTVRIDVSMTEDQLKVLTALVKRAIGNN